MTHAFILASGSPRRKEILGSLGIPFTVVKPDIDETQGTGENAYAYAERLSQEKAAAVANKLVDAGDTIIVAADTIVVIAADTIGVMAAGDILGKPVDAEDARLMLERLRGGLHVVCTALTVLAIRAAGRNQRTALTRTRVTMRDYTDAEIAAYIATGDPFDKAGGYAIQHDVFAPVAQIDGSYTNVVGLPVETLRTVLAELGVVMRG